jgi:hypothetical protein
MSRLTFPLSFFALCLVASVWFNCTIQRCVLDTQTRGSGVGVRLQTCGVSQSEEVCSCSFLNKRGDKQVVETQNAVADWRRQVGPK